MLWKARPRDIHVDLGEVQGFKYHNGVVFSATLMKLDMFFRGGRYDCERQIIVEASSWLILMMQLQIYEEKMNKNIALKDVQWK